MYFGQPKHIEITVLFWLNQELTLKVIVAHQLADIHLKKYMGELQIDHVTNIIRRVRSLNVR